MSTTRKQLIIEAQRTRKKPILIHHRKGGGDSEKESKGFEGQEGLAKRKGTEEYGAPGRP